MPFWVVLPTQGTKEVFASHNLSDVAGLRERKLEFKNYIIVIYKTVKQSLSTSPAFCLHARQTDPLSP